MLYYIRFYSLISLLSQFADSFEYNKIYIKFDAFLSSKFVVRFYKIFDRFDWIVDWHRPSRIYSSYSISIVVSQLLYANTARILSTNLLSGYINRFCQEQNATAVNVNLQSNLLIYRHSANVLLIGYIYIYYRYNNNQ